MEDLIELKIGERTFVISWETMAETVWFREKIGDTLNGILAILAYAEKEYFSDGLDAKYFIENTMLPKINDELEKMFPKDDNQPQFDNEIERFKWLVKNKLSVSNNRLILEE